MKFNFPNIISLLRILIAPVYFILMICFKDDTTIRIACLLFLVGALTDFIDGWYARKYQEVTNWGNFVDPLADKILTTAAFLSFVFLSILPLWMVLIILIRDFGTTFMRLYSDSIKKPLITSKSAKLKTFIQMTFIAFILLFIFFKTLHLQLIPNDLSNNILYSKTLIYVMLMLTLFTLWTIIEYIYQNKIIIKSLWFKISKKLMNE